MDRTYILPEGGVKRLRAARTVGAPVYIFGAAGSGKTELVRQYLSSRRYSSFSCGGELWDGKQLSHPAQNRERREVVVVDDLHLLRDAERQKQLTALVRRQDVWLILLSRAPVPLWLLSALVETGFLLIGERELALNREESAAFLAQYGVELPGSAAGARGNPFLLELTAQLLLEGRSPGAELEKAVAERYGDYLAQGVVGRWPPERKEFLRKLSVVDEFDLELAKLITGSQQASRLLGEAMESGGFLTEQNGVYTLEPSLRESLRRQLSLDDECMRICVYNAGLGYELTGSPVQALAMYDRIGMEAGIRRLLVDNARLSPEDGHLFEMRRYYLRLPEADVAASPALMAALCMLYSLLMRVEESESWYARLREFYDHAAGGERQEAGGALAYLTIALPHRGSGRMLDELEQVSALEGVARPEFSITTKLPSVMNGGKDFCHWSREDRRLAATVGPALERVLGRNAKGLVPIALGESLYEKGGGIDEVLSLLARGQLEAESNGAVEIAFAAVGVKSRLYLTGGSLDTARMLLDAFENKAEGEPRLLANLAALRCRLALYRGDWEAIRRWMEEAPNEEREFSILERYRYLTKARCYLALGEPVKALSLLEQLRYFARHYERPYIAMEVGMLTAIARERMGAPWQDELLSALETACSYGFVRIVCEEGAALLPLLHAVHLTGEIDRAWFERAVTETGAMAVRYPVYLKRELTEMPQIGATALRILRMQADGLSITQIADRLEMKPVTVKYHAQENYRKLGVSGKTDAALAARSLGLL